MNIKFNFESKKQNEQKILSSKPELVIKRFKKWAENNSIYLDTLNSEDEVKTTLQKNRLLIPGVTADEVMIELKKSGIVYTPKPEKVVKPIVIHHLDTELDKLPGITKIENENLKKQLEENHFFEELEKETFKNEKDLDFVYNKALIIGKENTNEIAETEDYYNEFADAGLIKGGREEVQKDFQFLMERKNDFKKEIDSLESGKANKVEKAKKIATIVERGVACSVSELEWYGKNVSIEPTSEFDDIKRGVDEVLQIRKDGDDDSFMGLGIDATYRGLLSEQYKEKFFILLQSIRDGHKTRIKYFKNHKGERMKEFSVPKIILFFNMDDVKELANMIKNIDDPKVKEDFKNSPKKFALMNQMIIQCEILSAFAEDSKNDIFRKYTEIVSSFKELAWENPDIKQVLDGRHEDEVSHHMKYLIKEFKDRE